MYFPLEISPYSIFSILRITTIPDYSNSYVAHDILNDYVFIFHTFLNPKSEWNRHTDICLAPLSKLSLFSKHIKDSKIYEYTGKPLVINESIEIIEELTEHERKYIAILKNHPAKNNEGKLSGTKDMRILLLSDNGFRTKRCDNIPVVQLAPEFQKNLEYYRAYKMLKHMEDTQAYLAGLSYRTVTKDGKDSISTTLKLIKKEVEKQNIKVNKLLDDYIDIKDLYT